MHHLLKAPKALDLNLRLFKPHPTKNLVDQQRKRTLRLDGMTRARQKDQKTRQQTKQWPEVQQRIKQRQPLISIRQKTADNQQKQTIPTD